jgi:hypothetical protein
MRRQAWTQEELDFLEANKALLGSELACAFNKHFNSNRSVAGIRTARYKYFGVLEKQQTWTQEELDFLEVHKALPRTELARVFNEHFNSNRSSNSICAIRYIYFGPTGRKQNWTQEELDFLEIHKALPESKLVRAFNEHFNSNRSVNSIKETRYKYFGTTGKQQAWTQEELDFLEVHKTLPKSEIARAFNKHFNSNRSSDSICAKRFHHFGPIGKYQFWTQEEVNFLEAYKALSSSDLASAFNEHFNSNRNACSIYRARYHHFDNKFSNCCVVHLDGNYLNISPDNLFAVPPEVLAVIKARYKNYYEASSPADKKILLLNMWMKCEANAIARGKKFPPAPRPDACQQRNTKSRKATKRGKNGQKHHE